MKEIPLTQGKVALVDDEDYEWLSKWKWHAFNNKYTFYAVRQVRINGSQRHEWMHRVILKMERGNKIRVDHKDRDGLHNWKDNLRTVTNALNSHNRKRQKNNKSGYRGVYRNRNRWEAQINTKGHLIFCGCYTDPVLAAKAYDEAAIRIYGKDAVLNFPQGDGNV